MKTAVFVSYIIESNYRVNYLLSILHCLKEIKSIIQEKLPPIIDKYLRSHWVLKPLHIKEMARKMNNELSEPILNSIKRSPYGDGVNHIVFVPKYKNKAAYIIATKTIIIGVNNHASDFDYKNYLPIVAHEIFHSIQYLKRPNFFRKIDKYSTYAQKHDLLNRSYDNYSLQDDRIIYHSTVLERQGWYVGILLAAALYDIHPEEFKIIINSVINGDKEFFSLTSKYKLLREDLMDFYKILTGTDGMISDSERVFFADYLSKFPDGYEKFLKQYNAALA